MRGLPAGGEARLTVLGLGLLGLGSAVMLLPAVPAVLAGAAVVGLGIPMAIVGLFTVAQQHTPPHLQGRVAERGRHARDRAAGGLGGRRRRADRLGRLPRPARGRRRDRSPGG
nr:hypothetical protein GCM10020092_038110 [Actinoplanes digitatis]